MSFGYLHIYGFNLTPEGELGLGTIKRLQKGLQVQQKTGCVLVVSARVSPRHEQVQPVSMAELMREWLLDHGADADLIWKFHASTFNTEGECRLFYQIRTSFGRKAHCSSWWHLPRIFLLALCYRPKGEALPVLVPVWDIPSVKMCGLEMAKIIAMFFPQSWQLRLKSCFEKMTGQTTSY